MIEVDRLSEVAVCIAVFDCLGCQSIMTGERRAPKVTLVLAERTRSCKATCVIEFLCVSRKSVRSAFEHWKLYVLKVAHLHPTQYDFMLLHILGLYCWNIIVETYEE